jgi:peptidoglycan/LPS O-acetylase OafA/YrhL
MDWLDALRGVAVLLVVYAHLSRFVFEGVRAVSGEWLNAGPAGVMLFFLVSGYIIPASLERHGDLRAFWISRLFRLVPLYLVVAVAVVVLGVTGRISLDPFVTAHPVTTGIAHATMLPFLLGVPLITPLFWTLTFEMVFYLLVTCLFTLRIRNGAPWMAGGFAVAGMVLAPLPARMLGASTATVVVAVLLIAGLAAVIGGRGAARTAGGVLLGALALTLPVFNQDPAHAWDGLLILAVMFTGTVIYRADRGITSWRPVVLVGGLVTIALLRNWFGELVSLDALTPKYMARSVITLLVFGGAFAVGMLTRRFKTPRFLVRLGVLSYSVYLVHWVLLELAAPLFGHGIPDVLSATAYLAVVVGVCWLTQRYIEVPGQRLGLRLRAAFREGAPARSGPRR